MWSSTRHSRRLRLAALAAATLMAVSFVAVSVPVTEAGMSEYVSLPNSVRLVD